MDLKPCVPTSEHPIKRLEDQNISTRWPSSTSTQGCNCNDQSTTSTSGRDELLLSFDQCEDDDLFRYLDKYLPGYRFVPTDDQLIRHYLRKKLANERLPRLIRDVNIYRYHPKDLAARHPKHDSLVDEWYFFTPRDRKYPKGSRPNRAADKGYWKATGADKAVKFKDEIVGYKQALVFYEGKPPKGKKTNWIMHEFKALEKRENNSKGDMRLDDCVLCRIYHKKVDKPPQKEEVPSTSNAQVNNHVEEAPVGNNSAAMDDSNNNGGLPSMINYYDSCYEYEDDILIPNLQSFLGEEDTNFLPNLSSSDENLSFAPFGSEHVNVNGAAPPLDTMVSRESNGWGNPTNFDYTNFNNVHHHF